MQDRQRWFFSAAIESAAVALEFHDDRDNNCGRTAIGKEEQYLNDRFQRVRSFAARDTVIKRDFSHRHLTGNLFSISIKLKQFKGDNMSEQITWRYDERYTCAGRGVRNTSFCRTTAGYCYTNYILPNPETRRFEMIIIITLSLGRLIIFGQRDRSWVSCSIPIRIWTVRCIILRNVGISIIRKSTVFDGNNLNSIIIL